MYRWAKQNREAQSIESVGNVGTENYLVYTMQPLLQAKYTHIYTYICKHSKERLRETHTTKSVGDLGTEN